MGESGAVRANDLLKAYNEGIGDGLIAAAAILTDNTDELRIIKAEIRSRRSALRRPLPQENDR